MEVPLVNLSPAEPEGMQRGNASGDPGLFGAMLEQLRLDGARGGAEASSVSPETGTQGQGSESAAPVTEPQGTDDDTENADGSSEISATVLQGVALGACLAEGFLAQALGTTPATCAGSDVLAAANSVDSLTVLSDAVRTAETVSLRSSNVAASSLAQSQVPGGTSPETPVSELLTGFMVVSESPEGAPSGGSPIGGVEESLRVQPGTPGPDETLQQMLLPPFAAGSPAWNAPMPEPAVDVQTPPQKAVSEDHSETSAGGNGRAGRASDVVVTSSAWVNRVGQDTGLNLHAISSDKSLAPAEHTTLNTLVEHTVTGIRYLVKEGVRTVTVRLVPESLGELRLEVTSARDVIHVRLVSQNPAVRETLGSELHVLRMSLAREGIGVGQVQIASGMASDPSAGGTPYRTPEEALGGSPRPAVSVSAGDAPGPRPQESPALGAAPHRGVLNVFV